MLLLLPECRGEEDEHCEKLQTADHHDYGQQPFAQVGNKRIGTAIAGDTRAKPGVADT